MADMLAAPPTDDLAIAAEGVATRRAAPLAIAWRRYRHNRLAMVGLVAFGLILLIAIAAPLITPGVTDQTDFTKQLYAHSVTEWSPSYHNFPVLLFGLTAATPPLAGTAMLQNHSVLALVTYGARVSLLLGVGAALISALIGVVLGVIAGYFGGLVDTLIMRVTDLVLAFPFLPLVIAIAVATRQHPTVTSLLITFSLVGWPGIARIMRAQMLIQREQAYTEAAIAVGVNDWRIIFRHLLPNAIAPVFIAAALSVASFILAESTLDYIELGITDRATWGNTIAFGQNYISAGFWWVVVFPGIFLVVTSLAATFIGEGLRDALDARDVR